MFLTCPNCETVFRIDSTRLGKSGRAVRCSVCSHVWQAGQRRAGRSRKRGKFILVRVVMVAAVLATAGLLATHYRSPLTAYVPVLLGVFESAGISVYPGTGQLEIRDLEADYAGDTLRLRGRLANKTLFRAHAPQLHIKVSVDSGKVLADTLIKPEKSVVAGRGSSEFFAQIVIQSDEVPTLTVTMRNEPVIWHPESGAIPAKQ